jgi:hypothetical protein
MNPMTDFRWTKYAAALLLGAGAWVLAGLWM